VSRSLGSLSFLSLFLIGFRPLKGAYNTCSKPSEQGVRWWPLPIACESGAYALWSVDGPKQIA
jgi:hypothetical protein